MAGPVIRLDKISQPGANPNWGKGSSRVLKPGLGGASWPGTKKKMKENECQLRTSRDIS